MTVDPKDTPMTLEDARALRAGTYHEDQEDDDDGPVHHDSNDKKSTKSFYFVSN